MDFTTIFVSVETYPDDNTNSPGPIMLMDMTSSQTVKMRFPKIDSLWAATLWYNMESPSDGTFGDSAGLDPVTDGYSVWFSTYTEVLRSLNDTLSIDSSYITADTLDGYAPGDTTMIVVSAVDTNSIYLKDTALVRGLDTIVHTVIRFDVLLDTLVDTPYYTTTLGVIFGVDSGWITYDQFTQGGEENDEFALPVLSEYGWKYKGWVACPAIDPDAVTSRITLPAWVILGDPVEETEGGILTTGCFADVRLPDECNPYVASTRVPPYPGEDFLENLPGGIDPPCFVPNLAGGNPGRIFVSLQPDNFVSDTTNFPLIPFIGPLPDTRNEVTDPNAVQSFVLRGWMQDTSDPYRGFPWILVEMERF
ncbi:MAG: hypothetical protein JSU74_11750 [Candidatus Zixiibacteriota bacterium]|nr:MAG: hypothetical protein JSU74_11750 [candidate division Zixibacteria bacterium]